jgi:hypothetical protein
MSPASSKKTSCVFNTVIQSLPSARSILGSLQGGKNYNSAETRQISNISPKFTSSEPLVHYGQTIWEADFKNKPKTRWGKELNKWKSVWLSDRSQHDSSMYEAGGPCHPKFQQYCVDGYYVLGYWESLRHNMTLWPTTYIVRIRILDKSH